MKNHVRIVACIVLHYGTYSTIQSQERIHACVLCRKIENEFGQGFFVKVIALSLTFRDPEEHLIWSLDEEVITKILKYVQSQTCPNFQHFDFNFIEIICFQMCSSTTAWPNYVSQYLIFIINLLLDS